MAFLNDEAWQGKVYSGGWITSDGGDAAVIEPATGRELGRIGLATPDDVTRAVKQAAAAQPAWAATPHTERSAILRRAADIWLANAAEIEDWVIRESGKIGGAAAFETHNSTQEIYEAATLPGRPYGELLPSEQPRLSFAERVPVGVVGVISPFNFPQILATRSVAPGARARQRGGAQAGPAHVRLRRRRARPGLRGGRPARGPAARAAGRPGRRRGADHRPAGADHLVHRLHRRRPAHRRAGRPPPQAGAPGARRQLRPGHPRRRRRRRRRLGRRLGVVPAPGADLHDHRQAPGARGGLRRLRGGAGGEGLAPPGRRPGLRSGRARPDHRRAAAGQGARAGHGDHRRGRQAGGRRDLRGPVLPAHGAVRGHPADAGLGAGGVRPGRARDQVLDGARRRRPSPRRPSTGCPSASSPRT